MLKKFKIFKSDINGYDISKNIENYKNELTFPLSDRAAVINCTINGRVYGDRFIPRRSKKQQLNKKLFRQEIMESFLMWDLTAKNWLQYSLMKILDHDFNISEQRILQFSETANFIENEEMNFSAENSSWWKILATPNGSDSKRTNWICKARRKPLAYAESMHDAHGFSLYFEHNLMDWSMRGQVVASFADYVTIWRTIHEPSISFRVENTSCLAYEPTGKYLAIACIHDRQPVIELWDVGKQSRRVMVIWRYYFKSKTLRFECLTWSECGRFLLGGTNNGDIYTMNVRSCQIVDKFNTCRSIVLTLRFSSRMRYLATADAAGNVDIYTWHRAKLTHYLHVCWKRKTKLLLDWHPYKNVFELAVAESKPASIVLLDVPSKKTVFAFLREDRKIKIDSLNFNKITAELCVSISKAGLQRDYAESKILVFSSLNRLVDVLGHENGARFLMWHPDGTRLIATKNDNSLVVWNFYPKKEHKRKNNHEAVDELNEITKQKLFYGCDKGEEFQFWSNIR